MFLASIIDALSCLLDPTLFDLPVVFLRLPALMLVDFWRRPSGKSPEEVMEEIEDPKAYVKRY